MLLATPTAVASRNTALSRAANARSAVMSRRVPTKTSSSVCPGLTRLTFAATHTSLPSRCLIGVSYWIWVSSLSRVCCCRAAFSSTNHGWGHR